jgi:hypothetical protein
MNAKRFLAILLLLGASSAAAAQATQQAKEKKAKKPKDDQLSLVPHEPAPLFGANEPVQLTLTANLKQLRRDKAANAPWRGATLSYVDTGGKPVTIPAKVRTRGIWRLKNCDFPPVRLNFAKEDVKNTAFAKLDKPKLVTHCRDTDEYEQYILQEFQLYRVYNTLTPYSHKVRLARVAYVDSASGKPIATRYAFISEDHAELAHRVGGIPLEQQGAGPNDLDAREATLFAVFQYLIGNTDWSISGLHNVELVGVDTAVVPIAYDFDYAGAVNARYATTDPRLRIKLVRQRLFRGYCLPVNVYPAVFELFRARKDSIYALYRDDVGKLLKPDLVKETLAYFDEFYETINDPKQAKRELMDSCLGRS